MSEQQQFLRLSWPALVLCFGFSATPTFALENAPGSQAGEEIEEIVVTGSRIKRTEFSSAVPVQIIDMEVAMLAGQTDVTAILQESTLAANAPQANNSLGYNWNYIGDKIEVFGGDGTNTIDLRGLGVGRTLVLLNGRRLNPAGTRGTVSAVDLNSIPSSMIQRIEILKDGATSVYGSDAVSGVVNIITKKYLDGASGSLSYSAPFDGGGQVTKADLSFGINGDRSSFLFGVEYFEQDALLLGDRKWMQCATEMVRDPETGDDLSIIDPTTGEPKCFDAAANDYVMHYGDYTTTGKQTRSIWDSSISEWRVADPPERSFDDPTADRKTIVSPVRRISLHSFGSWGLDSLGDGTEGYVELQYNSRRSEQNRGPHQFSVGQDDSPWSPFYNDDGWASDRALLIPIEQTPSQDVDWLRGVLGFAGELASGWSWDINIGYGRSDGTYSQRWFLADRVQDMLNVVEVADGDYDCAVNLEPDASGECTPFNPYTIIQDGLNSPDGFPLDRLEYAMFSPTGTTIYSQRFLSAYLGGDLFTLPAGSVKGAFGIEGRRETINDSPDSEVQADNLHDMSGTGVTRGADTVKEVFAEVELPLLRDLTIAEDMTINVAGRYSDYDTAGSDTTYRVGLNWQIIDQLRFRSSFGTSFRAPALYESFLNGSRSYIWFGGDPCIGYQDDSNIDTNTFRNCQNEVGDTDIRVNQTTGVVVHGNAGLLEPETSESLTAGLIVELNAIDFAIAFDYFEFLIQDQIGRYGPSALVSKCFSLPPSEFRQPGTVCDFVSERDPGNLVIQEINDSYFNINQMRQEGIDLTIHYGFDIGTVEFVADLRASKILEFTEELSDSREVDLNGIIGYADFNGQFDLRAHMRDWTFYYGLDFVAGQSSYDHWGIDPSTSEFILATDDVTYHDIAVGYDGDDWSARLGIQNVADRRPPLVTRLISSHAGNAAVNPRYDLLGCRYFLSLSADF